MVYIHCYFHGLFFGIYCNIIMTYFVGFQVILSSMDNSSEVPEPKVGDLPEDNSSPSALPEEAVPLMADPAVQEVDVQQAPEPQVEAESKEEPPVLECEASNDECTQAESKESQEMPNICAEPEKIDEAEASPDVTPEDNPKVEEENKIEAKAELTEEEQAQSKKRHIEEIVSDNVVKKLKTIADGDQVVPPKKVSCEE